MRSLNIQIYKSYCFWIVNIDKANCVLNAILLKNNSKHLETHTN